MVQSFGKAGYAKIVQRLIERIYHQSPLKDSFYEQSIKWFANKKYYEEKQAELEQQLYLFENRQQQAGKGNQAAITRNLKQAEEQHKTLEEELEEERYNRYSVLHTICRDILNLCQGDNFAEINHATAKLLGTIQLITPTRGRNIAKENQKSRHLYKAVLSIRLLDRLLMDGVIDHPFILQRYEEGKSIPYHEDTLYHPYRDDVHIPVLMAAILQDIGRCHPICQTLLRGEDGSYDEFRDLEAEDRNTFLQTTYAESLYFFQHALTKGRYMGRSREERDRFVQGEIEKRELIQLLLKSAIKPQDLLGSVLRIPQVYAGLVFSTRSNYNYEDLPKAVFALEKSAEQGKLNKRAVAAFNRIVGVFPQGFGITYIPKDSDGHDMERYEYAIVTGLYPPDLKTPICRIVTYALTYQASARGCVVSMENNLYFPQGRKKLEVVTEERLLEILRRLVHNFEERMSSPLLPRCWHPDDYFLHQKNQNLWNKAEMIDN